MATSGTFTGSRGGSSTGPYLILDWSRIEEDVANNRSLLRLTLKLKADYDINFSADKSGNLEGTSFTYTTNVSNPGTYTLKTKDMWVNHNSDGTKSITLDGSFNIQIYWGGNYVSSLSVSGTASINTIPRASDFTAFALADQYLAKDQANTVNYTVAEKSSSFSHYMTLKVGSSVIKTWTDSGTGARTWALTAAEVNTIITKFPNDEGVTLSLVMQTKSGSTNIGSAVTRTDWVGLESSVAPVASGLTVSIYGTGRDKTINKYVQNISKVTASFTRSAGYGATISSSSIVVRRQSDDANSQTIGSNSGTTANVLTLSGVYEIIATVTDSRGRTDSVSTTITVEAYAAPSISKFTTSRTTAVTTNVSAAITATWSPLGTSNPTDITIVGVDNANVSTTHYNLVDSTAGTLNTTQTYSSQSDASSYTYTITVTDTFGKKATAVATVGTSFVELTIAKGLGVGIGKVHENGALDVKGDFYLEGDIWMTNGLMPSRTRPESIPSNANLNDYTDVGSYYCSMNVTAATVLNTPTDQAFSLRVEKAAGSTQVLRNYVTTGWLEYSRNMYNGSWGPWYRSGGTQGIITPSFGSGWTNYNTSSWVPCGYYKTAGEEVRLQGMVSDGTKGSTIFTLPVGYRPEKNEIFACSNGDGVSWEYARIYVYSADGRVVWVDGGTSGWISLSGIVFRAA